MAGLANAAAFPAACRSTGRSDLQDQDELRNKKEPDTKPQGFVSGSFAVYVVLAQARRNG